MLVLAFCTTDDLRPSPCRIPSAVFCASPMMPVGIVTLPIGAGIATFRMMLSPFLTSESGTGSVEITVPGVSFETWFCAVTFRPSFLRVAVAWATGLPVTLGRLNEAAPPKYPRLRARRNPAPSSRSSRTARMMA